MTGRSVYWNGRLRLLDDDGLPVHMDFPVTADGLGPAIPPDDPEFDHWVCWCGKPGCVDWLYS